MNSGPITRLRQLLERRPLSADIPKPGRALYRQIFFEDLRREDINWGLGRQKVKSWAVWERFEHAPVEQQITVACLTADRYDPSGYLQFHMPESAERLLASQILRTKLPLTEAHLTAMVYSAAASLSNNENLLLLSDLASFERYLAAHPDRLVNAGTADDYKDWACDWSSIQSNAGKENGLLIRSGGLSSTLYGILNIQPEFPVPQVISLVERHSKDHEISKKLRDAIEALYLRFLLLKTWRNSAGVARTLARLQALLDEEDNVFSQLKSGLWGQGVKTQIEQEKQKDLQFWIALIQHCTTVANKAKPSHIWLNGSASLLSKPVADQFERRLETWLEDLIPDPSTPDPSLDILKSVIWCASQLESEKMALTLGRFATRCFTKVPDYGPRSTKLGNACLYSLSQLKITEAAAAELVRIRQGTKYPNVKTGADKALAVIAKRLGTDIDKLEQAALPDFGLDKDGTCTIAMGKEAALLSISRHKVTLHWLGQDGAPRKSVPAEAKRSFPDLVKGVKQKQKDLSATLAGQIAYLESSYVRDHSWTHDDWIKLYLDHPLRREITENLIWQLEDDSCFLGKDGAPETRGQIRLWHPLFSSDADVRKWQARIEKDHITQPFKQAHREVYRLSQRELETSTYSNRFAAHIVRQHQFRELCLARHWTYYLQGSFDSWNTPVRHLPNFGIEARFYVDVAFENPNADYTIISHLTTEKLEFRSSAGKILNLKEVPPIAYSEIARDVDLFTSVASKVRNSSWLEPGENEHFHQYWQRIIHGDLSPAGQSRRTLLKWLIPQLEFGEKLKISANFIEATGTQRSYLIHIGSANVITKDHSISIRYSASKQASDAYVSGISGTILPFIGDTVLTSILNTAAVFVADDKIKDKTLLEELERVKRIELSS